jgi:uncharacterized alpha/beta hydrolase family protein
MISFFSILFILIGINAVIMFFSLNSVDSKEQDRQNTASASDDAKIYPIDLLPSKYKKAM